MKTESDFYHELKSNYAFLAKSVFDLHCLIQAQSDELYQQKEMDFPVSVSSTLLFLSTINSASITQIAKALNHPHQVISKRIKKLLQLELINGFKASEDKRTTIYSLSDKGKEKVKILDLYCIDAAKAFQDLSKDVGIDIQKMLNVTISALKDKPFGSRFPKHTQSYSQRVKNSD